jgi:DNA-binding response OmpR family regulator
MSAATILVVDDRPHNAMLLCDLLAAEGYATIAASSGPEALARIASDAPQLVLLDVVMPGMDGYAVCRAIRNDPNTAVLPVVMVTAQEPAEERVKGLEAGADDFLAKPINPPELLARVRSLLRFKSRYDAIDAQGRELAEWNTMLKQRIAEQVAYIERLSQRSQHASKTPAYLRWINVATGPNVRLVTVEEICYFRAEAKYTYLVTADQAALIRTPLKELLQALDPSVFWQIHRSTIVNVNAIEEVTRDMRGHLLLRLKSRKEALPVSQPFAHLFRQM